MVNIRTLFICSFIGIFLISINIITISAEEHQNGSVYKLSTIAGDGDFNDESGVALASSFRSPQGVLVLDNETILIADTKNNRIRQLANENISTFAGFAFLEVGENGAPVTALLDGNKETATFNQPNGLAADDKGNIYVADSGNHAIRKINTEGVVETIAGNGVQGLKDGIGDQAQFYRPSDVAVTENGTIYVADTLNHVIRQINPNGKVKTLNAPSDRAVEVIDGYVVKAGDFQDGPLETAKFNEPTGLALDGNGNLYVADSGNQLIRYIDVTNGTVSTVAGIVPVNYNENALYAEPGYTDGGDAMQAMFNFPKGLAVTNEGGLVIADSLNHTIRYLYEGEVTTLAGNGAKGNGDGMEKVNQLQYPTDVAVQPNGAIVIADAYNNKIRKWEKVTIPKEKEDKTDTDQDNEDPKEKDQFTTYIVKPGDFLSTIAPKFNTTWQNLKQINKSPNPDLIYPKQELLVPNIK